jgi:hypothetical protein
VDLGDFAIDDSPRLVIDAGPIGNVGWSNGSRILFWEQDENARIQAKSNL